MTNWRRQELRADGCDDGALGRRPSFRTPDDGPAPVDVQPVSALQVQVFPVEVTRWIAVIEAQAGPLSTEVRSAALVAAEVARVIRDVLGPDLEHVLVDEAGHPWSERVALEQVGRLAVQEGVGGRLTWWERAVLDALLTLDFPDAWVLRQQARSVVVTESCQCGCPRRSTSRFRTRLRRSGQPRGVRSRARFGSPPRADPWTMTTPSR